MKYMWVWNRFKRWGYHKLHGITELECAMKICKGCHKDYKKWKKEQGKIK